MTKRVRKAIFPVGGLGTRFLPATKALPKEMLTVVDKPIIQYAVEEAKAAGIEEFIFVTGRGKTAIEDHFDHSYELSETLHKRSKYQELAEISSSMLKPGQVAYTRQQDPLGLGHAVWCAKELVGREPFAVMLPDDMVLSRTSCMKQLIDVHARVGGHVVAVEDVPREQTSRYGILDVASDDGTLAKARGLVEKPRPEEAPSTLAIIGRYVLDPSVFDALDKHTRGAGNEIQLTDGLNATMPGIAFHGLRFEGIRYDCGTRVGFVEANVAFALANPDLASRLRPLLSRLLDK